jgi:transcriptional regulator with XRE-family HTH domain
MTRGQTIRAHRERRRLTELQCAVRAGVPHQEWKAVENDELTPEAQFAAFLDRFTDGDVAIDSCRKD